MWTTIIVKCMTMSGQLLINSKCKICSGQAIVSCMLVCHCLSWGVAEEDCHCISTHPLNVKSDEVHVYVSVCVDVRL